MDKIDVEISVDKENSIDPSEEDIVISSVNILVFYFEVLSLTWLQIFFYNNHTLFNISIIFL